MRRLVASAAVLSIAAGWLVVASLSSNGARSRVAAVFANAQFVVPGEDVKLGGVAVGKIASVTLDPSMRARILMDLDPRFGAFRADAQCSIEPQSLIGERFVQCTPGTPSAPPLQSVGGVPTVPVVRTSAPVDLDLVLATFRGSRGERLRLLLNELGIGLAGRADDLNATIRRANPALQGTREFLDVVRAQRARLAPLIRDADRVVADLDRGRDRVASFITSARRTTEITALRREDIRAGLRGLPPLLHAWRPALANFGALARDAGPITRDLSAAAPQLQRFVSAIPRLALDGRPALDRLSSASVTGRDAVRPARKVVRRLRTFAATATPVAAALRALAGNVRDRGVIEGATQFVFNATGVVARFDKIGHTAVAEAVLNDCLVYATTPGRAECNGHFGGAVPGALPSRRSAGRPARAPQRTPSASRPAPVAAPTPADRPQVKLPGLPPISLPSEVDDAANAVSGLLDFLLGR